MPQDPSWKRSRRGDFSAASVRAEPLAPDLHVLCLAIEPDEFEIRQGVWGEIPLAIGDRVIPVQLRRIDSDTWWPTSIDFTSNSCANEVANRMSRKGKGQRKGTAKFRTDELPIYLVFHWIGQPTASVAAVAYIPKSAEIGKALGWAWTEGLNGEMKRGPRCGAYLLRESDYAHDRLVNYARDKHSEQAVDAAIQVLRSHASELTPVLSSAFLTITDEVIRMRAQLNANGVQSNSKNARQVPTYNVSISDQKLVDEAKRFLTQMKKQQSAKLDPSTPDEWGIREVRDWLKSKEGTNFETLGGRKEFAKAANEIVASIGCGFVCCKCENVFVSLAAANAGYSKGSFVMKHRVEKKLERHLSSIRFPALVFVPNLSNLIAKDLGR